MAQLVVIPDRRKPGSNEKPNSWMGHDGTIKWTQDGRSEVDKITTSTGHSFSKNISVGIQGSIYASSKGFSVRVQSKTDTEFHSYHYFGDTGGLTLSDLKPNQTVNGSNKACHVRDVTGFFCEINGKNTIDGDYGPSNDSANDGCGTTKNMRVFGIYIDSYKKTHIYQMTERGSKVQSGYHTWSSTIPGSWTRFGYFLPAADAQAVIDKKLMLVGWVIGVTHKKVCGNKQKNMTGRLRYMTPLVASDPSSISLQESGYPWQIVMPPTTTADKATRGWTNVPLYTK